MPTLLEDDFRAATLSGHWIGGHQGLSDELTVSTGQGLLFSWPEGTDYASGAIVSAQALRGDFSASVLLEVEHPQPACTVELAAVTTAPPSTDIGLDLPPAMRRITRAHQVFDVHGAPPNIGSEYDEDDGWRSTWNLGDDAGQVAEDGTWRKQFTEATHYLANRADVRPSTGAEASEPRRVWLRLARYGDVWQAYGRTEAETRWQAHPLKVSSPPGLGTVARQASPRLAGPVFLRIAAKHWKKREGGIVHTPPANRIRVIEVSIVGDAAA